MKKFEGKIAEDYDTNILKVLPGYELVHKLSGAYLKTHLKDNAEILLVGAGTCKELELLGQLNSTWKFYAQDIQEDMLIIGKQKLAKNILARSQFLYDELHNLGDKKFDAVLSIFVLHFVPSYNKKLDFLYQIKKRLKNNGFLVLADLMNLNFDKDYKFLANQYEIMGMSPAGISRSIANLKENFYPQTEKDLDKILMELNFSAKQKYFQALEFSSYIINF